MTADILRDWAVWVGDESRRALAPAKEKTMEYTAFEDKVYPGSWRAEAFDSEGGCYVVIFSGPHAEIRAKDYAFWINNVLLQQKSRSAVAAKEPHDSSPSNQ